MKYIRTKDGIYEVKYETDITYELNTQNMVYRAYKTEVIKQADTIEELVDEYVVSGEGKPYVEDDINFMLYLIKNFRCNVYGSIWVNDNLVKVAKMNEKGELELL